MTQKHFFFHPPSPFPGNFCNCNSGGLLRNRPGSDAVTSCYFLRERLQRAFTRANQLHWTAQKCSLKVRTLVTPKFTKHVFCIVGWSLVILLVSSIPFGVNKIPKGVKEMGVLCWWIRWRVVHIHITPKSLSPTPFKTPQVHEFMLFWWTYIKSVKIFLLSSPSNLVLGHVQ